MSRTIFVPRAAVLVVILCVSWSTSDAQAGVLKTMERASGHGLGRCGALDESAVAFLEVVQGIERAIPCDLCGRLAPAQLLGMQDAVVAYRRRVGEGVSRVPTEATKGSEVLTAPEGLGRDTRRENKTTLEAAFRDP